MCLKLLALQLVELDNIKTGVLCSVSAFVDKRVLKNSLFLPDSTTTSLVSALYRGEAARLQGGFCSLSQISRGENIKKKIQTSFFLRNDLNGG